MASEFGPSRSTTQKMLDDLQYIYKNLDSDYIVISIFLDFSKGFDCINHKILSFKLNSYGFKGITNLWFASYLSDRNQFVYLNFAHSSLKPITDGVIRLRLDPNICNFP